MNKLQEAQRKLLQAQGLLKADETLEEKILKLDNVQPLNDMEKLGLQAWGVACGDWGPVFCYGQMLSQQAWCALIGRVPLMQPCWLRGYERREIICSTFAGLIRNEEDEDCLTVGQAVLELLPFERRLLDKLVDDGFELIPCICNPLDNITASWECTTYVWRQELFPHAVGTREWSQENFNRQHEEEFTQLCADLLEAHRTAQVSDEELKELSLKRRRNATGFEDEEEFKPEEEEAEEEEEENYDDDA